MLCYIFKGLRPPAAGPQTWDGVWLGGRTGEGGHEPSGFRSVWVSPSADTIMCVMPNLPIWSYNLYFCCQIWICAFRQSKFIYPRMSKLP